MSKGCGCLQGHFQIMFNPKVCPLLQSKLPIFWRLMYCQGCWSYVVGGVSTPFFIALPIITIWIGLFSHLISMPSHLGFLLTLSLNKLAASLALKGQGEVAASDCSEVI